MFYGIAVERAIAEPEVPPGVAEKRLEAQRRRVHEKGAAEPEAAGTVRFRPRENVMLAALGVIPKLDFDQTPE